MSGEHIHSRPVIAAIVAGLLAASTVAHGQVETTAAPLPSVTMPSLQHPFVVLDHVVAVINGDVILESDVQEELHFAVLQPDRAEVGRNTPEKALARLIDRHLILQQIKLTGTEIKPPTDAQVKQQLAELGKQIPECAQYHCETEAGWHAFLASRQLTESEVIARWRERMFLISFIQARFGAGLHISDAEVEQYYKEEFEPVFAKKGLHVPPLKEVANRIQEILLQRRVSALLRGWLQSLRESGNVRILSPEYAGLASLDSDGESSGEKR